jgi:hypothetical protein
MQTFSQQLPALVAADCYVLHAFKGMGCRSILLTLLLLLLAAAGTAAVTVVAGFSGGPNWR